MGLKTNKNKIRTGHMLTNVETGLSMLLICLKYGTSLVVQGLRIHLPRQGMQVRFLVGELRFHKPWSA